MVGAPLPWVLDEIAHKKSPVKNRALERKTRFELATLALARRCSTTEPLPHWCPEPESNQRHADFQSAALPTELSGQGCLTTFVYITEIS